MLFVKNLFIEIIKFPFVIILGVVFTFLAIFTDIIKKIIITFTSGVIIMALSKFLPLIFQ
ncbi:hypothetical protein HpCK38_17380 [Helicobacter pylori]